MKHALIPLIALTMVIGCRKENPVEQHDEQFIQIDFSYGFKDELNTFEGFVQKDLILDGAARKPLWFSKAEQSSIVDVVIETKFLTFPDTLYAQKGVLVSPDFSPDQLRIRYNGQDKTVVWFYPLDPSSEFTAPLNKLALSIKNILVANETYKKLPPARGGYQ